MIESLIAYLIIAFAIIMAIVYIMRSLISVFKEKSDYCNNCNIEKVCKKKK